MKQQDLDKVRSSQWAWIEPDNDSLLPLCLWHFGDLHSSKDLVHVLWARIDLPDESTFPITYAIDEFSNEQKSFKISAHKLLSSVFANALVDIIMAYFPSALRYKESEHLAAKTQFMENKGYCEIIDCSARCFDAGKNTFSGKARCKAHLYQ